MTLPERYDQCIDMSEAAARRREAPEVKTKMSRCLRCHGRKRLFKVGSGYSLVDSGGPDVACPCCNGEGVIKPLQTVIDELKASIEVAPKKTAKSRAKRPQKVKLAASIVSEECLS